MEMFVISVSDKAIGTAILLRLNPFIQEWNITFQLEISENR